MTENKMSFTDEIVSELKELSVSKSCCRKAFLCGLLYSARRIGEKQEYEALFYREDDARLAAEIIDSRFSSGKKTEILPRARGGHRAYAVNFSSKALCNTFFDIDEAERSLFAAIGFRCADCARQFLSGVFISSATVSRPKTGYHLEFSAVNSQRAEALALLLEDNIGTPRRITRAGKIGLYYKSNADIAGALYAIGASKASFEMTNMSIERDIRNNENRATNCVTSNISRSVGATRKHVDAILLLIENQRLETLGADLEYTAKLRLENDSASLYELALMHQPPISKSGLNGRLSRILAAAEELQNDMEK